jgi:hypothetical protein
MSGGSPPEESPPAGADALTEALELARATLSDADAALEAATHALSPAASEEDSDSDASEPATDEPDDEATDSGSVSLSVDDDGVWVGVLAGDGDFDDESDYVSESYTGDSDGEFEDFDDDAMHFEIEGEIPLGPARGDPRTDPPVDHEEGGVYMLPDGEPIPSVTGMNHAQGSDSVGAASPGRLLVTGPRDVRVLDASETPARGTTLGTSEKLPFQVYSVTYDPDAALVAVCGAHGLADDVNLAVFRLADVSSRRRRDAGAGATTDVDADRDANANANANADATVGSSPDARDPDRAPGSGWGTDDSVMFIPVAEKGVGVVGRYGREMLNCVRFGKLARAEADDGVSTSTRNVLVCASQDEHCYVLSIDVKGDNGPGGEPGDDGDASSVESGSDGGQGGRGARRRPRLDATLVEEVKLNFPVAVNAAAASPDGRCVAVVGDVDFVMVNGGARGYGASARSERLPIDGDPETLNVITGEPQGGMYAAWSPDSRYLAATSDSLHAVAVWRVHVSTSTSRAEGGEDLRCHRVAYLRDHAHPCLPITFLPSDPNIVVWAERGGRVHAYDLRCAVAAAASTSSAVDLSPPKRREAPLAAAAREAAETAANDDGSLSDDGWELLPEEGVDVSLYPSISERRERDANDQRRFVQTIRSRVRGLYVTGLCAVAAPAPPPPPANRRGADTALGPGAFRTPAPPHDLVYVGVPNGVLRYRCPVAWTPETHGDFPPAFRRAARAFLLCAEADARRGEDGGGGGGLSLGDMPREVLLRALGMAAVPLSAWIGVGEDDGENDAGGMRVE